MKLWAILPLISSVLSIPTGEQIVLGGIELGQNDKFLGGVAENVAKNTAHALHDAEQLLTGTKELWNYGVKEIIKQNGLICEFSFLLRSETG